MRSGEGSEVEEMKMKPILPVSIWEEKTGFKETSR
jgi:hypothetical protein